MCIRHFLGIGDRQANLKQDSGAETARKENGERGLSGQVSADVRANCLQDFGEDLGIAGDQVAAF